MSGEMSIFIKVPDNYIVIVLTTVIFSCVWGLLESQDVTDSKQPSLKEESEIQAYSSSAPVLSQMDYEILGTSGFSITDVMQNTNFSDISKGKKNDKNQFDISKHSQNNSSIKRRDFSSLSVVERHPSLDHRRVSTTKPGIHTITTTNRPEMTSTENATGVKEVSTIKFSREFPYAKRTDSAITSTSILKILEFRPTTNSLLAEVPLENHKRHPSSTNTPFNLGNQKTSPSTYQSMRVEVLSNATESLGERRSLTTTEESLSTISNPLASTEHPVFTNKSSPLKTQIKLASNLKEEIDTILKSVNDTVLHENTSTVIVNYTLQSSINSDHPINSQNENLTTENIGYTRSSTIQPYSPFTQHTSTNAMLLTSSSTEPETSSSWATEEVSILGEEKIGYAVTDTITSTELPHLQLDEDINSLIPKIDHATTEAEVAPTHSSSSTESLHVTTGISPMGITADTKSTHVTPLFTEKPQLLVNVSGQIRIIRGMIWMYQLNDKTSAEFQYYSRKVQRMLEEMFWQTWLAKHIKKIDVHRFRRGSVMVDFRLVVKTERHIEPQEMELLFNSFLLPDGGFGGFQMDRHFTKFEVFEPVITVASPISIKNNNLPQWATALIVISGASLVFVVLFGIVTVYGTFPFLSAKNHQRLKDEGSSRNCKRPKVECTEWERKAAAAYENLSADGIYDLDEVGENKAADGYRRKLENTEA